MGMTTIQWTDETWNPVTGCTKVSAGCKNCYAERVFPRTAWDQCKCGHVHSHEPTPNGRLTNMVCIEAGCDCREFRQREFTDVWTHANRLEQPLHWKKPRRVFINSMSDLFHEAVSFEFIDKVFAVMGACDDQGRDHTFQILTKRPKRMREYMKLHARDAWNSRRMNRSAFPPRNVWLGISVEDQEHWNLRVPDLLATPAAVRFVSYEPALGPIQTLSVPLSLKQGEELQGRWINWIIVGGESGPRARPFNLQWARDTISQCKAAGVAYFYKQGGKSNACEHDGAGGCFECFPVDLQVREFPNVARF